MAPVAWAGAASCLVPLCGLLVVGPVVLHGLVASGRSGRALAVVAVAAAVVGSVGLPFLLLP